MSLETKATILVVDDSPTLRKMMVSALNDLYECIQAQNGEEALEIVREQSPDVILMDVVMPGRNGVEVTSELYNNKETQNIPVVLVTSTKVTSDDLEKGLKSGAIDYIRRPFDDIELKARVASAVKLSQSFQNLEKQNKELAQLNKIKSEFVAVVSHDLRSPFTSILGLTEILTEIMPDPLTAEQRKMITTISNAAETQLNYINNILDIAMSNAGTMNLKCEKVDFATLVEHSCDLLRGRSEEKKISLNFIKESEVEPIYLDKAKVSQVINNLLTNSIKFSHENSQIELTLKQVHQIPEKIQSNIKSENLEKVLKARNCIQLTVKDYGIGFSEKDLSVIFERYYQKKKRYGTKGEIGSGLGLDICKAIVELHNGVIWVMNNDDEEGVNVGFFIPYPEE
ncbi:MAG: hybrid sensor histidine kinase/response regulator [Nitrospinae bacterium]|nr:hybrid sensor histidine kinase/response regulator [Nitrospinota bacterium]